MLGPGRCQSKRDAGGGNAASRNQRWGVITKYMVCHKKKETFINYKHLIFFGYIMGVVWGGRGAKKLKQKLILPVTLKVKELDIMECSFLHKIPQFPQELIYLRSI